MSSKTILDKCTRAKEGQVFHAPPNSKHSWILCIGVWFGEERALKQIKRKDRQSSQLQGKVQFPFLTVYR